MHSDKGFIGSVSKSTLRVRTNYDLYDSKGNYEGVAICRILTLGSIYSWAREMDIYDQNKMYVGLIDGQAATAAGAKFSIYNAEGTCVGIAYLDLNKSSYTIVDPKNDRHHLASFKRNFIKDTVDHWDVAVYDKDCIDIRIIKIFAAFAVDTQNDFKKDK